MKESTKKQKGSESRDLFKFLHKNKFPSSFYALDSDLELVEKIPKPFIVARLDFKLEGDLLGFSEVIAYNEITNKSIPVYIIEAERPFKIENENEHRFKVYFYIKGDWKPDPPKVERKLIKNNLTWNDLGQWEGKLRQERRKEKEREQSY